MQQGLTTTEAPYIEQARANGELYIRQPYELYSEDNHEAWKKLYGMMRPRWERYANDHFMRGIEQLCFDPDKIPRLEDVNKFLEPLTKFKAKAVSGYVPAYLFFDCLRNRDFPTTITIRRSDKLQYLPEPDIFHDLGVRPYPERFAEVGATEGAISVGTPVHDLDDQTGRFTRWPDHMTGVAH